MPLNAGGPGYGSMEGPGLPGSPGAGADAETAPLLIPEPEPDPRPEWRPLTKEELEAAAGGPGWRRVRWYLVLLFWVSWVTILAISIAIIVKSPRPVARPLRWWQKSLFYQLQPELFMEAATEGPQGMDALCEQLPYLRSLGVRALILEDLFEKKAAPLNLTATGKGSITIPQIQHLLKQSNKADLKVVLDFCDVNLVGPEDIAGNVDEPSSAEAQYTLRFWLDQGVAGFTICDTDEAYSEKTLLEWRNVLKEFNTEEERIVLVRQTKDVLPPLSNSNQVDVVMKSILPVSRHVLSAQEVADAIETHLHTVEQDIWTSWTVGGKASDDLKKLLLVLTMTLPGSPAIQYVSNINQTQSALLTLASSHGDKDKEPSESQPDQQNVEAALFTSLSHSRAREEALLYGSFTFLPFNASSTNSSSNSTLPSPSLPPVLAFLRSWGCVHFLVLLNVGAEPRPLDPAWAPSLPEAGVFIASTGMDRVGSTSLYTLELRPQEAIVIKLFEAGSYS